MKPGIWWTFIWDRDQENAKTRDLLDELQHKIKYRDQDLQILYKKNLALKYPILIQSRQQISDHEQAQDKLRSEISRLEDDIRKLEREKYEVKTVLGREEEELKKALEQAQVPTSLTR